jgi:outer membrane protein assembly factor BamA
MYKYLLHFLLIVFGLVTCPYVNVSAQELSKDEKKAKRKAKKQEKIDKGKLMILPLAGPAYTPELQFTLAAGAYFFGTKLTSFWKQDKLRIYADLNFKNMPDNYWGVGYNEGYNTEKGDSTTAYNRTWWQIYPKFLFKMGKNYFVGPLLDFNYTKGKEASTGVEQDPFYQEFNNKPFNTGLGFVFQYDSRDVPVNAWKGAFIETSLGIYGSYLGGDNTYLVLTVDARKYWKIKRDGQTIAAQLKGRFSNGDVPYGEMSQPGTPFDLRGYTWGRYRDESMIFGIGEYRLMFKKRDGSLSRHGVVAWLGAGTLGDTVKDFGDWLPSVGVGYRLEVQPRMNLRIDIGFGRETQGFYFNFNEAF